MGPYAIDRFDLDSRSSLLFSEKFLGQKDSDRLFNIFRREVHWQQRGVVLFGKTYDQLRLVEWYGPHAYCYSGLVLPPKLMPPILDAMIRRLSELTEIGLNSVLLNYYRTGNDYLGWHTDNEPGLSPTIVSLSLGATRAFQLRRRGGPTRDCFELDLSAGSLLILGGELQKTHLHQVPRRSGAGPRINLTFREVL